MHSGCIQAAFRLNALVTPGSYCVTSVNKWIQRNNPKEILAALRINYYNIKNRSERRNIMDSINCVLLNIFPCHHNWKTTKILLCWCRCCYCRVLLLLLMTMVMINAGWLLKIFKVRRSQFVWTVRVQFLMRGQSDEPINIALRSSTQMVTTRMKGPRASALQRSM